MENQDKLHEKIKERYEPESQGCCSLSCGSTLDELEIKQGELILDLGCGRGEDTILAAKLVGDQGKATGLDLTPAMIAEAEKNAKQENAKNASFVAGDIENLPFEDMSFDGIISNCVINHARSKKRAYSEIQRVLKQGGRFVVADAVTKEPLPPEIKEDAEAWAQCFGGAITEEEYLESIRSAGFQTVTVLNRREYLKNGYDFISLTIKAVK